MTAVSHHRHKGDIYSDHVSAAANHPGQAQASRRDSCDLPTYDQSFLISIFKLTAPKIELDKGGTKRRRSDVNWVYQRREASTRRPGQDGNQMPVIHVAGEPAQPKIDELPTPTEPESKSIAGASEPRRFHVSRSMLAAAANKPTGCNIFKKDRNGPTVFVERTRRKLAPKPRRSLAPHALLQSANESDEVQQRDLKRPGVAKKTPNEATETKTALPESLTNRANEDMSKITADMNDWVLREVGANLAQMDEDRKAEQRTPTRFKPKAPVKRYQERHPATAGEDTEMSNTGTPTELSDEDDDEDWIIEEYVRVPANYMAVDVNPSDIGVLVLEGDEDAMLFYGSLNDDDDELAEDEEDENAENHYTADYPEDEVASDDEYGRNPYNFRTYNASDDEEFDENDFDDEDELAMEGDLDDDARMARIIERMKRQRLTTEQQLAQDYE